MAGTVGGETTIKTDEENLRQQRALTLLTAGLAQRWAQRLADEGEGWRARRRLLFHEGMKIVKRWAVLAEVTDDHYDGLGSSALDEGRPSKLTNDRRDQPSMNPSEP